MRERNCRAIVGLAAGALALMLTARVDLLDQASAFPVSDAAWSDAQWQAHCQDVRTSYNPTAPLRTDALTITPADPRFVDFVFWVWANKIIEHQVEQVGGTEWKGPTNGVIFHWAPGSRWETHTLVPFEHAIHHISGEHRWPTTCSKNSSNPSDPSRE
ncbi:MAG TPA: hypothetical protein VNK46_09950 [Nitrospiraceae bacterium]|jgi:hypothetical protein|nr:hypothetical protein [Nitrospiraceae bacterium]